MKCLRMTLFGLVLPCSVLALFLFFSGSVLANGAVPSLDVRMVFLVLVVIIMVVNIPFNLLLYLGFLFPLLWYRSISDRSVFETSPTGFFGSAFGLVFFASFIGGFIDALIFVVYIDVSPWVLLTLGLAGIFLSFFLLSMVFHKLRITDAALVALGITLANILFWFALGVLLVDFWVIVIIDLMILLLFMPWIYYMYQNRHLRLIYGD